MENRYNFNTKVIHKDATYTIRNNSLYEGRAKVKIIDNAILSNKIIRSYIETITKAKYIFKKTDSFAQLVMDIIYIMKAYDLLRVMKSWSTGSWRRSKGKSTLDKFEEEINSLVTLKLNNSKNRRASTMWEKKKFDVCQNIVLHDISRSFLGSVIEQWYYTNLYDPKKKSTKQIEATYKKIKAFNFGKYGIDKKPIVTMATKYRNKVTLNATNFKKLTDIAGDDFVNWGPHKIAAQAKKHNISADFGYDWTRSYKEHLKSKGIKPVAKKEKKISMAQKLYDGTKLSQNNLIKAFKEGTESQAKDALSMMSIASATSLFGIKTKNVTSKLGDRWNRPSKIFYNIFDMIAEKENEKAYDKLRDYVRDYDSRIDYPEGKGIDQHCTWQYLFTYSEKIWSLRNYYLSGLIFIEIPDSFFEKHLKGIKLQERFTINSSITHAFLKRMNVEEKTKFLYLIQANDNVKINWSESANVFKDVSWNDVKEIIDYAEPFVDLIVANNDVELAFSILTQQSHCNPQDYECKLFKLLSFEQKIECLKNRSIYSSTVKKIIGKDASKFLSVAIEYNSLSGHIDEFKDVKGFNINTLVAKSKSPKLQSTYAKDLTQKNLAKVFIEGDWITADRQTSYYKQRISRYATLEFKALERKTYNKIWEGTPPQESPYSYALAHIMTGQEFLEACDNLVFVRFNFDTISQDTVAVSTLAKFHGKEEFKALVGDRRDRDNNHFGNKLEEVLKKLPNPKDLAVKP